MSDKKLRTLTLVIMIASGLILLVISLIMLSLCIMEHNHPGVTIRSWVLISYIFATVGLANLMGRSIHSFRKINKRLKEKDKKD